MASLVAVCVLMFYLHTSRTFRSSSGIHGAAGLLEGRPSQGRTTMGQRATSASALQPLGSGVLPALVPQSDRHSQGGLTRGLVLTRMKCNDISWVGENLEGLDLTIYVADDVNATAHPPKNKGHEVMVYLTFIIEHYVNLPDVIVFMHAHRHTTHNNDLLGFDATEMLQRLQLAHVIRQGYFNMRCHWSPGCPEWLKPNPDHEVLSKQEEAVLSESWGELFPREPLPPTLAQTCCAQFAVSKKRVQSIPKSRFIFYRDWLLKTPLSDFVSGRVWEYTWQFLFTGQQVHCPAEHICYCHGFGICFEGEERYNAFKRLGFTKQEYDSRLKAIDNNQPTTNHSGVGNGEGNPISHYTENKASIE